jgi:hypothetical protein
MIPQLTPQCKPWVMRKRAQQQRQHCAVSTAAASACITPETGGEGSDKNNTKQRKAVKAVAMPEMH